MLIERTAAITVRVLVDVEDQNDEDEVEEAVATAAMTEFKQEYGLDVSAKNIVIFDE